MKKILTSLIAASLSFAVNANAISVDLIPNQSHIHVGDSVELQLHISDLVNASAPSLGDYDVNLDYDKNIFQFDRIVWGDPHIGNQLDFSGSGSIQEHRFATGRVELLEISLDSISNLNTKQADNFSLFSIYFNSLAVGDTAFSLSINSLGDAFGNSLKVDTTHDTHVNIEALNLPEPATWLLFTSVLTWLLSLKRRR